jgi:prepilin-type N-terminal cleavage/methylation domain-containing protein
MKKRLTGTMTSPQSGFNLIEVIVALALLAAVLLTISGLFIQGSQSVNTGRDLTEATSLATDILEQMDKWAFQQLYTNFCNASGAAGFDFRTDTRTSIPAGSPSPCTTFDAIPLAGGASGWQTKISQRLPNAKATISMTPLGGGTFGAAKGIQVRVKVDWVLKLKPRNVSLETVRF